MSSFNFKLNRYPIYNIDSANQRIYNTVRVSQSEYVMNKSSLTSQYNSRDSNNLNWNTQSDRLLKANSLKNFNTFLRDLGITKVKIIAPNVTPPAINALVNIDAANSADIFLPAAAAKSITSLVPAS